MQAYVIMHQQVHHHHHLPLTSKQTGKNGKAKKSCRNNADVCYSLSTLSSSSSSPLLLSVLLLLLLLLECVSPSSNARARAPESMHMNDDVDYDNILRVMNIHTHTRTFTCYDDEKIFHDFFLFVLYHLAARIDGDGKCGGGQSLRHAWIPIFFLSLS